LLWKWQSRNLRKNYIEELGHTQRPTRINTDNSTACGIANDSVKQQHSCAMDMRFHWICDRVKQGQFKVNWERSKSNRGDYFTKHFTAAHHRREWPNYLHIVSSQPQVLLTLMRGCVETPAVSPGLGSPLVHQTFLTWTTCQWQPTQLMAIFVRIIQLQPNNAHYLVCSCSCLWYPIVCLVGYH
jgi:hypothetical protein